MVSGRWDWGQIVEWKSLLFVLSILFICMAAVAAFQLARIFYYRHRILSYHIGFLSLVFLWGVIRFFFFLLITAWSPMVYLVLYWTPTILEFAAFSLLVVFYVQKVKGENWRGLKKRVWGFYISANLLFIGYLFTFWILEFFYGAIGPDNTNESPNWLKGSAQGFSGCVFFVLLIVLGYYGYKVWRLQNDNQTSSPFSIKGASNKQVLISTFLIVLIFAFRSIYDFSSIFATNLNISVFSGNWAIFFLYLTWEIFPAFLLIALFWDVGVKTHKDYRRASSTSRQNDANDIYDPSASVAKLFNNDQRYETDEEQLLVSNPNTLYGPTPYAVAPSPISSIQ